MKHSGHFDDFLRDVVNLNQSRINRLRNHVDAVAEFIRNSNYEPTILRFTPQGSWAHKTIIKPPGNRDFDADMLMVVRHIPGWNAVDYIEILHITLENSDRYKDKVSRKTRCVRINYANDFHIDLIPIIEETEINIHRYYNCNLRENKFEETAPEAYTRWWIHKSQQTDGSRLRLVTRLLKYIRDIKGNFSCKSILLTTLVGNQVHENEIFHSSQSFSDLPTSFRTIISRLDDWLQQQHLIPLIKNPVLPSENYNRHWNQKKYENFRECIHRYREWTDDAYTESDEDESILKWRRIFGDEFAKSVDVKATTPHLVELFQFSDKWIAKVRARGRIELRNFPTNFSHVKPARWPPAEKQLRVNVHAGVARKKCGTVEREMQSGDIVPTDIWIKFRASMPSGVPSTFRVEWRVVNTGGYAVHMKGRRGDFYDSCSHAVRWESTKYRGVHWVEAFVINKRTEDLVGKSARFFVVID